jgi:outer membrane murein-binding lipoprotein Lpp
MADPTLKDVVEAISKLDAKLDRLDSKVGQLDSKFDQLASKVEHIREDMDVRFDKVDERFDALLDKLRASSLVHKEIAKRLGSKSAVLGELRHVRPDARDK